jgi:hypothetical protein
MTVTLPTREEFRAAVRSCVRDRKLHDLRLERATMQLRAAAGRQGARARLRELTHAIMMLEGAR